MDDSEDAVWRRDAEVLAEIGHALQNQALRVEVHLPAALAAHAVAAWERDDNGPRREETPDARVVRGRAAALALIGLAVRDRGRPDPNNGVQVDLDAWCVGTAIDAADELDARNEPSGQ